MALALKQAYRRANEAIFKQGTSDTDDNRMGTTLVSAVVRGKYATIANVGDSRAYLIRARQLTQITQDHSLVAEQVAKGMMSEDQARRSPQRNVVTQALGLTETLDRRMPSIYELTLLPEDRLLLCSDGFFDVMQSDDYVSTILAQNPQDSALSLATMAMDRGTTDNVSAIVLEVSRSLATVQREQIGTEIAANAPRMNPLLIPIVMILILVIAIVAGVYFYL
jgi:protein phosphatase